MMLYRKIIIFAILFCFTLIITGPDYLSALRPPLSRENLILNLSSDNPPTDDELKEIVRNTMGNVADHFQYVFPNVLPKKIDYEKIYQLKTELDKVKDKGKKVIVMGEGRSGEVIGAYQKCLEDQGSTVVRLKEGKTIPELEDGDMIILISGSGGTISIAETIDHAREIKKKMAKKGKTITIVGITASPEAEATISAGKKKTWEGVDILINIPGKTKLSKSEEGVLPLGGEFEQTALWLLYPFANFALTEKAGSFNKESFIVEYKKVLQEKIDNLRKIQQNFPSPETVQLVKMLAEAIRQGKTIFVAGQKGIDNHIAEIFAMRMQNFGILVYNIYDERKPNCKEGDILIALSETGELPKNECVQKDLAVGANKLKLTLVTSGGKDINFRPPDTEIYLPVHKDNFSSVSSVFLDSVVKALMRELNVTEEELAVGHAADAIGLPDAADKEGKKTKQVEISYTPDIENSGQIWGKIMNDTHKLKGILNKEKIYRLYLKLKQFDKNKEKLYFYAEEKDRAVVDYFGKLLYGVYKYPFAVVNEKRDYDLVMKKRLEEGKKNVVVNISDLGIGKGDEDASVLKMLILEGIMEAIMIPEKDLSSKEVLDKIKDYVDNIVPKIEELKKIDPNKLSQIIKLIVETKINGHNVFFFGLGESSDINKLLGYDLVKMGVKIPESDRPTRINQEDLVICVSRSGETPELIRDIQSNVIKNKVKTILFTGNENSTIAENLKINPENIIIQIDAGIDQNKRSYAKQSYVRRGLEGTFAKPGLPSKDYFHILLAAHFRLLALLTKENLKVVKEVSGQDYSEIFSQSDRVEIGFGKGDFLLEQARKNPTEKWVGIEINEKLASEVNKKAKNEGLKNVKIIGIGSGRENLISLLKEFKSNSLQGICINYPYYWDPKTVDTFINETVAKEFYRLLRINGEVVIVSEEEQFILATKDCFSKISGFYNYFKDLAGGYLTGHWNFFEYIRMAISCSNQDSIFRYRYLLCQIYKKR